MKRLQQIVFFLSVSIVVNWLCHILQSDELSKYLRDKIIELLIYIMAINTATISVVVTKLHDIGQSEGVSFDKTIREVKISLIEQIILIVVSVFLLIFYNSPLIRKYFQFHEIFFNTLITTVFIYAIDILRDTGMAIFEVIKYSKKK